VVWHDLCRAAALVLGSQLGLGQSGQRIVVSTTLVQNRRLWFSSVVVRTITVARTLAMCHPHAIPVFTARWSTDTARSRVQRHIPLQAGKRCHIK
jgi:hypothetical protein